MRWNRAKYAAAIGTTLEAGVGAAHPDRSRRGRRPDVRFVVEVDDSVSIRNDLESVDVPRLRGDAVTLTEVLSLRAPIPPAVPLEWKDFLEGLTTAFATE
jgi:hypothetical protein